MARNVILGVRTCIFYVAHPWATFLAAGVPVRRPMTDHIHTVNFPCRERYQGAFSTDLAQKSCTYIYMGYTYNCMGGAHSSFLRLTYKYCVLDPSKPSFSQVLSILYTLLSLIFFTAYRNTVDCAEHVYIHLHSNYTYLSTGTAPVHTFLHTNSDPDLVRFMSQQACSILMVSRLRILCAL